MMRGALVGFGEIARNGHWPAYASADGGRIVAVVDRIQARRDAALRMAPGLPVFDSLDALASSMSIDFVDICTPPALHPEPMLEAIGRGWHVLCEKPLLLDSSLVDEVRRGALAHGAAVVPVDNWKYAPIIRAASAVLTEGLIGTLRHVELETIRRGAAATADADGTNWRRDPAIAGGGIVMDHGWHALYLALHWFRDCPVGVGADLGRSFGSPVEDQATIRLRFPQGTARIALTWNGRERRNTIRLEGSHGEVLIDDGVLRVRGRGSRTIEFPERLSGGSHHVEWFAAMLPEVFACFREPRRAWPRFDEAAECVSIIERVYRADASLTA